MKNQLLLFLVTLFCAHGLVLSAEDGSRFQLQWQKDLPLTLGAAGLWGFAQYRYANMEPAESGEFQEADLLPWDRPFAGTYNPTVAKASDVLSFVALLPVGLDAWEFSQNRISGQEWGGHALMLLQAVGFNSALNLSVRSLRIWPRPFLYGSDGSAEERSSGQASGSFYSGHASNAFTIATFTSYTWWSNHPTSNSRYAVAAITYSAATSIAVLRVAAGKHFPSDVIVGAAVGSLFGWLVPWLHKTQSKPSQNETAQSDVDDLGRISSLQVQRSGHSWLLSPWSAGNRPGVLLVRFF